MARRFGSEHDVTDGLSCWFLLCSNRLLSRKSSLSLSTKHTVTFDLTTADFIESVSNKSPSASSKTWQLNEVHFYYYLRKLPTKRTISIECTYKDEKVSCKVERNVNFPTVANSNGENNSGSTPKKKTFWEWPETHQHYPPPTEKQKHLCTLIHSIQSSEQHVSPLTLRCTKLLCTMIHWPTRKRIFQEVDKPLIRKL